MLHLMYLADEISWTLCGSNVIDDHHLWVHIAHASDSFLDSRASMLCAMCYHEWVTTVDTLEGRSW